MKYIEEIKEKILLFDGAMGTQLHKSGVDYEYPEELNLTHPKSLQKYTMNTQKPVLILLKPIHSGLQVLTSRNTLQMTKSLKSTKRQYQLQEKLLAMM